LQKFAYTGNRDALQQLRHLGHRTLQFSTGKFPTDDIMCAQKFNFIPKFLQNKHGITSRKFCTLKKFRKKIWQPKNLDGGEQLPSSAHHDALAVGLRLYQTTLKIYSFQRHFLYFSVMLS